MSIADAVRTRELEARVAVLETRMQAIEFSLARAQVSAGGEESSQAMRLVQGQLNSLRARLDKADAAR